jgi:hypothetical protein
VSYIPSYLEKLDRSGTNDGWPAGIDKPAKDFAIERVKEGIAKFGQIDLDLAKRCIYDGYTSQEIVPECLRGCGWDWLYAVTYRALLGADARPVWVAET